MKELQVKENSGLLFQNGTGTAIINNNRYQLRLNSKKNNILEFLNDKKEIVGEIYMYANKKTSPNHPDARGEGKINKQTFASCWKHECSNGNEMLSFAFTTENAVTKFFSALKDNSKVGKVISKVDLTDAPL